MSPAQKARVLVVIPSRFGSQRLPGKPLADIGGVPMVVRVARQANQAATVSEVMVATDDERIRKAVEGAGFHAVMTRSDCPSGTDRIAEAVHSMGAADIIVNVQGDEPLIPPGMIDQAVEPLLNDAAIAVGTLVRRIQTEEELRNASVTKVVLDSRCNCLYFSRAAIPHLRDGTRGRWMDTGVWYRHIGLYVFRKEALFRFTALPQSPLEMTEKLEQLRLLENGIAIRAVITELESIAVDTEEDLARVRALVAAS